MIIKFGDNTQIKLLDPVQDEEEVQKAKELLRDVKVEAESKTIMPSEGKN